MPDEVDAATRLLINETAQATADKFEEKLAGFRMSVTCDERHRSIDRDIGNLIKWIWALVLALVVTAFESFSK